MGTDGRILEAALEYAARGWCVVPLDGKAPWPQAWQHNSSREPEQVRRWWAERPRSNVGVQLGPRSGIIDVETDGPEQGRALVGLFDGEPPATANFRSARGQHWLFRWDDRMASLGAVAYLDGIGVRLGAGKLGAQSVFPPSEHVSGARYEWIAHPDDVPIAEFPAALIMRLSHEADQPHAGNGQHKDWGEIFAGVNEGGRNEAAAAMIGKLLHGLSDPYETELVRPIWQVVLSWNASNRPPLEEGELRKTFESILKRERSQRTEADIVPTWTRQVAQDATGCAGAAVESNGHADAGDAKPGDVRLPKGWRLIVVNSDPPVFQLFAPYWEGAINVGGSELNRPLRLKDAALTQKVAFLPRAVSKRWEELSKKLILAAERRDAPVEMNRRGMVLCKLYEFLDDFGRYPGESEKIENMMVCRHSDGSITFRFEDAMTSLGQSLTPQVTHKELSACLEELGAETTRIGKKQRRFKLLNREVVQCLEKLALS